MRDVARLISSDAITPTSFEGGLGFGGSGTCVLDGRGRIGRFSFTSGLEDEELLAILAGFTVLWLDPLEELAAVSAAVRGREAKGRVGVGDEELAAADALAFVRSSPNFLNFGAASSRISPSSSSSSTSANFLLGTPPDVVAVQGHWKSKVFLEYWCRIESILPMFFLF